MRLLLSFLILVLEFGVAHAQDSIIFAGQAEVGYADSNYKYGQLFNNNPNKIDLNQLLGTISKPVDTTSDFDVGFKLQGMFGSDARFTNYPKYFFNVNNDSYYRFDLMEASASIHTSVVDFKLGQYSGYLGAETVDPLPNFFYTHSYIISNDVPPKASGIVSIWHLNSSFDFYASVDTGFNTSFDYGLMHSLNNKAPAFLTGLAYNSDTFIAQGLVHVGDEIPTQAIINKIVPKSGDRQIYDLILTWKFDPFTLVNETTYAYDAVLNNGHPAINYGTAQYVSYALTPTVSLNGRFEVFVDAQNAFVAQYGNNIDYQRIAEGLFPISNQTRFKTLGKSSTYYETTAGVTYKPWVYFTLRPEIRYDTGHYMFNSDLILSF